MYELLKRRVNVKNSQQEFWYSLCDRRRQDVDVEPTGTYLRSVAERIPELLLE